MALDPVILGRFLELTEQERTLKEALRIVGAELERVDEALVANMVEEGLRSVKLDTGDSVYLHRRTYPKMRDGMERRDVIEALRAAGYDALVEPNYNSNRLNALVSEWAKSGGMPQQMTRVLELSERVEARVRRGAGAAEKETQTENVT
jgi:hypothetical protein